MINIELKGRHFDFVYVNTDGIFRSRFGEKEFLREVVRLHINDRRKSRVSGEDYFGEVERGEFRSYFGFTGREYDADIQTPSGRHRPKIIFWEKCDGRSN